MRLTTLHKYIKTRNAHLQTNDISDEVANDRKDQYQSVVANSGYTKLRVGNIDDYTALFLWAYEFV